MQKFIGAITAQIKQQMLKSKNAQNMQKCLWATNAQMNNK
jgi:hypothetical protein